MWVSAKYLFKAGGHNMQMCTASLCVCHKNTAPSCCQASLGRCHLCVSCMPPLQRMATFKHNAVFSDEWHD